MEDCSANCVDLSGSDNAVKEFAQMLFTDTLTKRIPVENDGYRFRLLMDNQMDIADVFCMLLTMVLYGVQILTQSNHTIFHLSNVNDCLIDTLNQYLIKIGFTLHIYEMTADTRTQMFATILTKQNDDLPYTILHNPNFHYQKNTPLTQFKAYFQTISIVFVVYFSIHSSY